MEDIPAITVMMSVYNSDETLELAIMSILSQTFTDFEFIIVNDGSSDLTGDIIQHYQRADERIRAIHNKQNLGLTRSLNVGLAKSQGKYVARQDSDDISVHNRLELQINYLENHPNLGMIGIVPYTINKFGIITGKLNYPITTTEIRRRILHRNTFCHGSVMIRRDLIVRLGGYREFFSTSQDYDLWLRVLEVSDAENLTESLYMFRTSEKSITSQKRGEQIANTVVIQHLAQQRSRRKYDDFGLEYAGQWQEAPISVQYRKIIRAYKYYVRGHLAMNQGHYVLGTFLLIFSIIVNNNNKLSILLLRKYILKAINKLNLNPRILL